jgi:aryl-alcohol dehydrogenase-like predicted oxidoreductase
VVNELKAAGAITDKDIVGNSHCMHPAYLDNQLKTSLKNLGVESVDLFYLHNCVES